MTEFKAGDKVRITDQAREGWRGLKAIVIEKAYPYVDSYKCKLVTLPTGEDEGYFKVGDKVTLRYIELAEEAEPEEDLINHPKHYTKGMPEGVEVIDIIEAQGFGYCLGNATKYLLRANHKGTKKQDLNKLIWYVQRELANMESA